MLSASAGSKKAHMTKNAGFYIVSLVGKVLFNNELNNLIISQIILYNYGICIQLLSYRKLKSPPFSCWKSNKLLYCIMVFLEVCVDEGISGTHTKKREGFLRMIDDAVKNKKIDIILTKSVS